MNTKVAILGKLPTKFNAPFDNKKWDIWTLNKHIDCEKLPRVDLWFDIHSRGVYEKANITRKNFPFKAVEKMLGGQYFNNSIAYMIAYAIYKRYTHIALYGMNFNSEHEHRRDGEYQNVRELIFFAKGKGIKVTAPADYAMLKEYKLYGV